MIKMFTLLASLLTLGATTQQAHDPDPIVVPTPCLMQEAAQFVAVDTDSHGLEPRLAQVVVVTFSCDTRTQDVLTVLGRSYMRPAPKALLEAFGQYVDRPGVGNLFLVALGADGFTAERDPLSPVTLLIRMNGGNRFADVPKSLMWPAGTAFLVIRNRIA